MALSPADFVAYSRATGTPYPESPEERAQIVPEVRAFRQNQLQAPQQQESNSLALGLGIGLGLAGVGGGLLGLRGRAKKAPKKDVAGKSGVKMTDLSDQPVPKSKTQVYEEVAAKAEEDLPQVTRPSGGVEESMLVTDPETGEVYRRGGSASVRQQQAQEGLNDRVNELLKDVSFGEAGEMLAGPEVAAETRQMTGTESSRQSAAMRRLEKQEERQAKNILSELAQETPTLTETYETFGEPAARAQNIDAVDTASDQIDSRFESTVQRDVDSVFEGKPAVAAEKLEVYGPVSAENTAALARDQMVNLRAQLETEGLRPGTTRFERALAERFKTGETTKLGELGVTGRSLEQVTLPSGPMRQIVPDELPGRSIANIGEDPFSSIDKAASDTSIRGRSRIQNEPEQFRQRVDSSGRRIDDEFGVELTELDTDTGEPRYSRKVMDSVTEKLTPEFAPKGQRVVQLYQGEGQPTKSMYIPESDPGGIGIYGAERSFAAGPVSKFGENLGEYTKTAQRKPTDLPYPQKKGGDLTDMSTPQLETFASNAVKKNPRAAQAAMSELERREVSKRSVQASEAVRRANIEGRDPQMVLRSMGFGV